MYDYRAMMVFSTVVEQGSMQAAAEKLSMTPSAVTQTIQKLEKQLKIKLLQRTTRKHSLTDAGNVFYQHIAQINHSIEEATRSIEALRSEPAGELNIACATGFLDSFLIKSFKTVLDEYPELHLNIVFDDNPLDLAEQRIDIMLCAGDVSDKAAVARHLCDSNWILVGHSQYLEQHGMPKSPHDLEKLDWIGHPKKNTKKEHLVFYREKENITIAPKYRINCNSINAAKRLATNGLGITKIPFKYVQKQLETGELVELCPDWKLPSVPLYLVTQQRIQSEKVRIVCQLLLDYFKNNP